MPVAVCLLWTAAVGAQAVSEWRLPSGLPVALVETPAGDVQRIVVLFPAGLVPPESVLGFPTTTVAGRDGIAWTIELPAVLSGVGLQEVAGALSVHGAAAVVTLGPTPARMLGPGLEALHALPWRQPRRTSCVVADGVVDVRRGGPERVELALAAFPPDDDRFVLLPALAAWMRLRLARELPGLEVTTPVEGGCTRILLRAPAPAEHPRTILDRLHRGLRLLTTQPATQDEVRQVEMLLRRDGTRWAVDGAGAALRMAQRLALGGSAAGTLFPPAITPASLATLADALLAGRPGSALLLEQERRPVWEPPDRLDNGVLVAVRWVPGEAATIGLALAAVQPEPVLKLGRNMALALGRQGWPVVVKDLLGIPTVAVAVPAEDVVAVIELLAEFLVVDEPPPSGDGWAHALAAAGLAPGPSPVTLSVVLMLPPEAEEATEAVAKFLSGLRPPADGASVPLVAPGLTWDADEGPARLMALVDLPPEAAGFLAGEVLAARVTAEAGVTSRWLQPAGRLVLAITASGEGDIPALDRRLAGLWQRWRREVRADELSAAARRLSAVLFGDMGHATVRTAAEALVAGLPRPEALVAADPREVSPVLAGLPRWEEILRFAHGPGPEAAPAPQPPRRQAPRRVPGAG